MLRRPLLKLLLLFVSFIVNSSCETLLLYFHSVLVELISSAAAEYAVDQGEKKS